MFEVAWRAEAALEGRMTREPCVQVFNLCGCMHV